MTQKTKEMLVFFGLVSVFIVAIALFIAGFLYLIQITIWNPQHEACQEIGFVEAKGRLGIDTCGDSEGNLHYVDMDCKGLWKYKCSARKIKVGDVEVAK